jgi:hypothetical protein
MDLRAYYRTMRAIEAGIPEESVVIVSLETGDGGRAGVCTDVPRAVAARMITEEKAELASPDVAVKFHAEVEAKWKEAHGTAFSPTLKKER